MTLCDRVTGRTDCASVLEHLERNQLFTIAVDQRGAYRYHEVLRAHLDAVLQQRRGAAEAAAHHRRVGELLEAEGRIDDALHAYSRAGHWTAVSRLVVHRMAHPSMLGPVADDAWIELVPSPIVENDPYLLLARARERTVNGRLGAALRDYDRAAAGAAIDTLARTCEEERATLAGWADPHAPVPPGWLGALRRVAQTPEIDAGQLKLGAGAFARPPRAGRAQQRAGPRVGVADCQPARDCRRHPRRRCCVIRWPTVVRRRSPSSHS